MSEKIVDWLLAQGWAGIVILTLFLVVVLLWKALQAKTAECSTLQEKRIAESREILLNLAANTRSLDSLANVVTMSLTRPRRG